jgi:SagB-type dehydrogenase family enzyme
MGNRVGGLKKMKRLTILTIILAGCAALCLGQYRPRVSARGSALKIIQLAEPRLKGQLSFEEALAKRRSVRQFTGQPLKMTEIGQLAWAGQGITEPKKGLRTAPSAGEIYPIELYFAAQDGLFVYRPQGHSLEQIFEQDVRGMLAAAASMQEAAVRAGCDIIVAGSARRLSAKFREEARKYMLLEAGHIAQNIQLQAVCLDLGSVTVGGFDIKEVSRICKLPKELEPIYLICVGYPATGGTTEGTEQTKTSAQTPQPAAGSGKRAVLIIAGENFQDEEFFLTQRALEAAGVETVIASTRLGPVRGMLGGVAEVRVLVNQLRVDDFDAIIFIGGSGAALQYFGNPAALNIASEAARKRKVLAAISIAPTILANAGVLTGVRATSFLSEQARLVQAGAIYTGAPVERDRFIITATGPAAAALFGQAIVDTLAGR